MVKFLKNLEGKVSEFIDDVQKAYSQDEDEYIEPINAEDHKKLRIAAEIFLVGSAAGTGVLGAYAKEFPVKTTLYSITGVMIATYLISKLYGHYKMKKQCKNCKHELRNVEKLYEKSGVKYGQSIGPCTLFKPNQMMLNCFQHKKYEGK